MSHGERKIPITQAQNKEEARIQDFLKWVRVLASLLPPSFMRGSEFGGLFNGALSWVGLNIGAPTL